MADAKHSPRMGVRSTDTPRHYFGAWIIQGTPDQFDVAEPSNINRTVKWRIDRFSALIRPNDLVYIYRAKDERGIYGMGRVVSVNPTAKTVDVEPVTTFSPYLKEEVLLADPALERLPLFRSRQGTVFKPSPIERMALDRIVQEHSSEAESIWPWGHEPVPVAALADYVCDKAVYNLIGRIVTLSDDHSFDANSVSALASAQWNRKATGVNFPNGPSFKQEPEFTELRKQLRAQNSRIKDATVQSALVLDSLRNNPNKVEISALQFFETARSIAVRVRRRHRIRPVDVFGAMFVNGGLGLPEYGDEPAAKFLNWIGNAAPSDNLDEWWGVLTAEISEQPEEVSFENLLAHLNADVADGTDHLGIKPSVDAIASILAANTIEPPFAIGLFGDWGAGKTFFMKQVKSRVRAIANTVLEQEERTSGTADAVTAQAPNLTRGRTSSYHGHIVQVWFNAWHYVQGDLWASLVSELFTQMNEHFRPKENEVSPEVARLYDRLGRAKEEVARLKRQKQAKQIKLAQLETDEWIKRVDRIISEKKLEAQTKRNLFTEPFSSITAIEQSIVPEIKNLESCFGEIPGLKKAGKNAQEIIEVIDQITSVSSRSSALFRSLFNLPVGWFGISMFCLLSVLVFLIFHVFQQDTESFETLYLFLTEVGVAALLGLRWVSGHLRTATATLDFIESKRRSVAEALNEEKKRQRIAIAAEQKAISAATAELERLDKQSAKVQRDVERLEKEIEFAPSRALSNFINERAKADDYRKHLGLLAQVRKDFEELSKLMKAQKSIKTRDPALPNMDRIVIYIDDLDRCSKKHVVEVLQAVHLLLAFDLFMVVVGVDSRWVTACLKGEYDELLTDDTSNGAASPEDYLEKIFQLPFWLRRPDPEQAKDLISGLANNVQARLADGDGNAPEDTSGKAGGNAGQGNEAPPDLGETEDEAKEYVEDTTLEKIPLNPASLNLEPHEVAYMKHLAPVLMRSPRSVKRFVNSYKVLKASEPKTRTFEFSKPDGEYLTAMTLLAFLIGQPKKSRGVLENLQASSEKDAQKHVESALRTVDEETGSKLVELYKRRGLYVSVELLKRWVPLVRRLDYRDWRNGEVGTGTKEPWQPSRSLSGYSPRSLRRRHANSPRHTPRN